jgi:hypothetical protein
MMSERPTVKKLVSEARIQLRVKKDRVRALELATAADAMLADMDADAKVRADIYASVAALWLELGDEQRSELRIVQAIETEAHVTPARLVILGTHKLFYAKLLHAQQRFADAARHANEGLAIYAQGVEPKSPELARVRADLAPILKHTPDQPSVERPMRGSDPRYLLAGEVVGAYRLEIADALRGMPVKVYLPDDNNDVNLSAHDFSVSIYPWEPEGGDYFLAMGNIDLDDVAARDMMNAFIRALENGSIAARFELTTEDDTEIFETAMWNPSAPQRVRGTAKPALVLGARLRTGSGDEVRAGTLGDQPVLVTLTTRHASPYAQLANQLRLAFVGIASLESIGAAQAPYDDMMIERLPAGQPATDVARLPVQSLAQLGAAIADVLAQVHGANTVIGGVQPELIYVDDDGRFTGLVPRGPRFINSAPQPIRGLRSYRVPYIGHEGLVLGQRPSRATDVFALCASLFVLGSGTHPFGDPEDLGQLVARVIADQREPWPAGGALAQLLARGLAQRPDERPTAAVLAGEFALIAGGAR